MRLADLPLLLAAAILLVSGAIRNDSQWSGELLIGGFIAFGAWLAIEVDRVLEARRIDREKREYGQQEPPKGDNR